MPTDFNLPRMDPPPLDYCDFQTEMKRWLSDLIDAYNQAMQQLGNVVDNIDIGGSGAGPISVPVVDLTNISTVIATIVSSSNPVSIISVKPVSATISVPAHFDITFSADPGASAIISYVAYLA